MVELKLDGDTVGRMDKHDLQHGLNIQIGEQVDVQLDHDYTVNCVVLNGNPPPAVNLSSGGLRYAGVVVAQKSRRDPGDRMSVPNHEMNASMTWKATVQNIGLALNCTSGIEQRRAVWTSFVPIVSNGQLHAAAEMPHHRRRLFFFLLRTKDELTPPSLLLPTPLSSPHGISTKSLSRL